MIKLKGEAIVKDDIFVSVITVTYNCEKTIQRTIDSVVAQQYSNIEYIIVDGVSSDNTLNIIKASKKKYPGIIKYVSEKDKGLYDAMNKGIKMANGEIIGIINGDDYYTDFAVQSAVALFEKESIDIVYSDLIYCRNGKVDTEHPLKADHRRLVERMSVNHPTCFVKKSVYDKYGIFDTQFRIAADYEIMARFYANNCIFKKSDKVLAVMEAGGLSNNNWKTVNEKYLIHRKYFSRISAELYRVRNVLLYVYRVIKRK